MAWPRVKTKAERQAATRAAPKCKCGNVAPERNHGNAEPLCGRCEAIEERRQDSPIARAIVALEAIADAARQDDLPSLEETILTLAEDSLAELRDPSTGKIWGLE